MSLLVSLIMMPIVTRVTDSILEDYTMPRKKKNKDNSELDEVLDVDEN